MFSRPISNVERKFRDLRYSIFYSLLRHHGHPLETLGDRTTECAWTFEPTGLSASSIVYSAGVGKDITFEHALVTRYGCFIFLLDPSPTGLETMARPENQISNLRFLPLALTGHSGDLVIGPPGDPIEASWQVRPTCDGGIAVKSTDLASLMRKNRHDHVDLLKLDIEGSEYDVIDQIVDRHLDVRQLCVEFHHGMAAVPGIRRSQTIRAMLRLAWCGYKLIDVSGTNHTFLKRSAATLVAQQSRN
ncbi:MAG: hypothetical protein QOG48_2469 [Verrucomicrobiota bacterium]|jgi:FkbM family methyltransferase